MTTLRLTLTRTCAVPLASLSLLLAAYSAHADSQGGLMLAAANPCAAKNPCAEKKAYGKSW